MEVFRAIDKEFKKINLMYKPVKVLADFKKSIHFNNV